MDIENYNEETHKKLVEELERKFGSNGLIDYGVINDWYCGLNTTIEVVVEKSTNCKITLTLTFGDPEEEVRKESASVLVTYGTFSRIKKLDDWNAAITGFEKVVLNIDDFFLLAVKQTMRTKLRNLCKCHSCNVVDIAGYDRKTHEKLVEELENKFGNVGVINDQYRGRNTIIEVIVKKSTNCKITLTLTFGNPGEEVRKEDGNILITYGTLRQIRKFLAHHTDDWESAVAGFEKVVLSIDNYFVAAVQTIMNNLRYAYLY